MITENSRKIINKIQKHVDDLVNANSREEAIQWMADAADLLEESIEVIKELDSSLQ